MLSERSRTCGVSIASVGILADELMQLKVVVDGMQDRLKVLLTALADELQHAIDHSHTGPTVENAPKTRHADGLEQETALPSNSSRADTAAMTFAAAEHPDCEPSSLKPPASALHSAEPLPAESLDRIANPAGPPNSEGSFRGVDVSMTATQLQKNVIVLDERRNLRARKAISMALAAGRWAPATALVIAIVGVAAASKGLAMRDTKLQMSYSNRIRLGEVRPPQSPMQEQWRLRAVSAF